jgi:hypothetical protein
MSVYVSVAAVIASATTLASPEVSHFPGSYFDTRAKTSLQRRAMEKWPGPSQLVRQWREDRFEGKEKLAVLLGASASHDPALLPLYREAILEGGRSLRMAAAYGYRDLLGDSRPNLDPGVSREDAELLAVEMAAVAKTLKARPLVEFWLQAALHAEGKSMPGWRGYVLLRSPGVCFRAIEQIVVFDDFRYLATAYRIAEAPGTRLALVRLIEAVTLNRFIVKPRGARTGWGDKDMNETFEAVDQFVEYWLDTRCSTDAEVILRRSFAAMGVQGVNPFSIESHEVWLRLLRRGEPQWRAITARTLYEFGGAWPDLTILQAESPDGNKAWEGLLKWYLIHPTARRNHDGQPEPSVK